MSLAEIRATAFHHLTAYPVRHGGSLYVKVPNEWDGFLITAFLDADQETRPEDRT